MYLSDRDITWAIQKGQLIINPPSIVSPTSIDLHLDRVEEAQIWDLEALRQSHKTSGIREPEVHLGSFNWGEFSESYLIPPPVDRGDGREPVSLRGRQVIVRPGGFLLWQTKEIVGTPREGAQLICFVDGKSTKARTGILVHFTAPTIHAGWHGNVVLEIANLGPFTFVLQEDDVIAQVTVATISSIPEKTQEQSGSQTLGQVSVRGKAAKSSARGSAEPRRSRKRPR
jgi:dCTP deaminase